MQVIDRGDGEPALVIVGSLHGDEPAGRDAIQRVLDRGHDYRKPVRFIIANEEALEAGKRFLETDLNRSFPGDPDSERHEERLAAQLLDAIGDCTVLDLHTTHSYPKPFGTAKEIDEQAMSMARAAGVEHIVLFPEGAGAMTEFVDGIVVEAGLQGTEQAVENAVEVIERVLGFYGVIDREVERSDPDLYEYQETVEGAGWEFVAENFELVEQGEVFARRDGEELVAEEPFYPVLMSTNGYRDQLGFKAQKIEP